MTVHDLFESEPYLYDLLYDPREDLTTEDIERDVEQHPYETIYSLAQMIKELEK